MEQSPHDVTSTESSANSLQETAKVPFVRAVVSRRSVLLASLYNCDTASGFHTGRVTLRPLRTID